MLANILINKNILVLIHQIKIFIYKKKSNDTNQNKN